MVPQVTPPQYRMSDSLLRQMLASSAALAAAPELQPAADALRANAVAPGKCSACTRRRNEVNALLAAQKVFMALPQDKRNAVKQAIGVNGPIKTYIKVDGRVTPTML